MTLLRTPSSSCASRLPHCLFLFVILFFTHAFLTCGKEYKPEYYSGGAFVRHSSDQLVPCPFSDREGRICSFGKRSSAVDSDTSVVQLVVSPEEIKNGDRVEVSFKFTSFGRRVQKDDWLAGYIPETAADEDYLDWYSMDNFVNSSSGLVTFQLLNMRANYQFRYFTRSSQNPSLWDNLGSSNVVRIINPNEPVHAHLSLTGRPDQMRIMWLTNSTQSPQVQWIEEATLGMSCSSLSSNSLNVPMESWQTAEGTSVTYTASMMCGYPANRSDHFYGFFDPGQVHKAVMTGLKASTRYCYRYGSPVTGWSNYHSFQSVRMASNNKEEGASEKFVFASFGDMGESLEPGARSTMSYVEQNLNQLDLLLHIGDISYARGRASLWEMFFFEIEKTATQIPYMVSIGNHEYDHTSGSQNDPSGAGLGFHPSWGNYGDDSKGECSVPMYYRFDVVPNGHSIYWYSFDYMFVHFVMMSTEHDYTPSSQQYQWILQDLQSVDKTKTPWIVFTGHRPMYTSENYMSDYNVSLKIREYLEPLLYKYQVDVALWGHYHSYERTCPVYQETCLGTTQKPEAPIHLIVGMAGASLDGAAFMGKPWSLYGDQQYGYTITTVTKTSFNLKYYHNVDNQIYDEFTIEK